MKQAQLVPQGTLNRLMQSATEAWNNNDFQQTIDLLERASRLAPANWEIQLQLGSVYGLRFNYASAERCFEKAIRLAPNKVEVLTRAGQRAVDFSAPELGERYFQRATEEKVFSGAAFAGLAEHYEHQHRDAEALKVIERALQIEPNCLRVLVVGARLNRQAGRQEDAERIIRPALAAEDKDTRVRAFYEMGMILDRQGRYDEAMTAFLNAKSLLHQEAKPLLMQLQELRTWWGKWQNELSAEIFQRWFDCATQLVPQRSIAFLGGFARSGTTLLEQVLDSHPNLVSIEETQLFNNEVFVPLRNRCPAGTPMPTLLESAQPALLTQLRANYFNEAEKHIGNPIGTRLLIDKNPSVNIFIPAFVRVFPEIKLLIALRDPRDVCMSCFMQAHLPLGRGNVSFLSIEGSVEAYTRVMGLWRTLAPMLQGHYLEVRYEDVVENLEAVSRRTLDFLGVPWDARVLQFDEHARNKRVRSPTYADAAKPIYKRAKGRWQNYQKYFEPYLEKLEPFVKAFGY
jgi:Tfp pilus assembly protein PilF